MNKKVKQKQGKYRKKIKNENEITINLKEIKERRSQNAVILAVISFICVVSGGMGFSAGFGLKLSPLLFAFVSAVFSFATQLACQLCCK